MEAPKTPTPDSQGPSPRKQRRWEQELYKVFMEERRELLRTSNEAGSRFAKSVTTLSAGALVLSLAFMRDVVPKPTPSSLSFLVASWVLFSLSLILIVFSFSHAQFAFARQVDVLEESFFADSDEEAEKRRASESRFAKRIRCCNVVSLWSFILGLAAVVAFGSMNLLEMRHVTEGGGAHEATATEVSPSIHEGGHR